MGIPLPIPGREKKKVTKICKRDGRIVDFDQEKITEAILKALEATDKGDKKRANKLSGKVANKLGKKFHERTIPAVEEVQDLVEEVLVDESLTATVRAYILYREQHKQIREYQAFVDSDKVMEGYLAQTDWLVKENANMSFSLQGLNNHVASAVSKHYWLNKIYSPEVRDAHNNGELHIHDLYMLAPYCTGWDLKDLMMQGFGGVSGKIQCKPPKHLRTAMGQIVNFFYTVQGEIAGAVAFSNFDTYLAPFIRYDNLDYKQVKQSMQEFLFNMNVPTRVGFQTPFTNVTLDLKVPKIIKDDAVIIGGQPRSEKYGEFQEEMDLFNKVFADVMMEGDASGRVFTFPIPTYNITKNFDWESEVTDKIFEMTAKYGTPYFSNFVNSDMDPDDTRSMCCRLRLDNRELRKRGGGLFGANPLTGSIGVVTINMSRIGHLAKDKKDYFERLDKLMRLGRQSLEVKRKMLDSFTDEGLYPYCRVYLEGVNKRFGTYWKNHFNTIGINGMNESM
ncbi:ribonucleoside triphosphate reductase, partial [Candidatus Falkowbacteria bacterium]|nr:ribonucleoside triphosphate reductase [Candidatus Falkowbacteria bacterium]